MSQPMAQSVENCHRQAQRMEEAVLSVCQDRFGESLVQECLQPLTERLGRFSEEIGVREQAVQSCHDLLAELAERLP